MEEQQVVPAEQSKENFIKLAKSCLALLDTIDEMAKKIVHFKDSTPSQKTECFDRWTDASKIVYSEICQKLTTHFRKYYRDNKVLPGDLRNIVETSCRKCCETMEDIFNLRLHLMVNERPQPTNIILPLNPAANVDD